MTTCDNNEYGCDNKIPDEREGELCADCETEYQKTAAYYERLYRAEMHYTREGVVEAYTEPVESSKREALLMRLGE